MNYLKQPSIFKGRCYVCFGECHWLKYSKNIWTELRTPYFEHWEITHGWNPKIHLIWVSNPSGGTTLGLQNVFMTFRGPMVFLDLVPFFKSFRNSTKHPTPQPINFQNIVTTVTKKTHQVVTTCHKITQVMRCWPFFLNLEFQVVCLLNQHDAKYITWISNMIHIHIRLRAA